MKKHISKKRVFFKILIALTVLSSMLVSTLLGVTKAEYFKSLAKQFDLMMEPDLNLEYYLYDATTPNGSTFGSETGVYRNAKSFKQLISTGIHSNSDSKTTIGSKPYNNANHIIYRVKIPVTEAGYYTLDFLTYMTLGNPSEEAEYANGDFYIILLFHIDFRAKNFAPTFLHPYFLHPNFLL
jgi:hypothetical protein